MCAEISKEYISTFNRQLQTQLHNELIHDYAFPRAVCKSLTELFVSYFGCGAKIFISYFKAIMFAILCQFSSEKID
jgi:hypothetical protein